MTFAGANPDQLDIAADRIQQQGRAIERSARRLRSSVNTSPWHGRSADRFRSEFNSHYFKSLVNAASFLESAQAELRRNAREQRDASSVRGSNRRGPWFHMPKFPRFPHWGWPRFPKFPGFPGFRFPAIPWPRFPGLPHIELPSFVDLPRDILIGLGLLGVAVAPGSKGGSQPAPQPQATRPAAPPAPPAPKAGDPSGVLSPAGRSWQDAKIVHDRSYPPDTPRGNAYQCAAWARARWVELLPPGAKAPNFGHGVALAANNGGVVGGDPTLGAMVSMGPGEFGHVAIVEEIVRSDGQVRVRISEMNTGSDGSGANIGNPSEYSDRRWMVRNANNTWSYEGGQNKGVVTFAGLPK
jgi:surface antigen